MINIVLCTYRRTENLKKVFESLNNQTVSDNILLHVLNNYHNDKQQIEDILGNSNYKFQYNVIHYSNKNNIWERFIYAKKLVRLNNLIEYIIFIDDDMTYSKDWVEKLFNMRQKNHMITWYVKLFDLNDEDLNYSRSSLITYNDIINNSNTEIKYGNYGGPGGCIIDASLFKDPRLYQIKTEEMKKMDDLWLSYIINHVKKWKIKRSFLVPNLLPTVTDTLRDKKQSFLFYLRNGMGWHY